MKLTTTATANSTRITKLRAVWCKAEERTDFISGRAIYEYETQSHVNRLFEILSHKSLDMSV